MPRVETARNGVINRRWIMEGARQREDPFHLPEYKIYLPEDSISALIKQLATDGPTCITKLRFKRNTIGRRKFMEYLQNLRPYFRPPECTIVIQIFFP